MFTRLRHAVLSLSAALVLFASASVQPSFAWTSDNGNGTYTNPILWGDYPDPDIIRVDSDFYMVSTTFHTVPGIQLLHSKDLINWEIAGYALPTLDAGPKYNMEGGTAYGKGV